MKDDSMQVNAISDNLQNLEFLGNIIGPLFRNDPASPEIQSLYRALLDMDVDEVAQQWPFLDSADVRPLLESMKMQLKNGSDNNENHLDIDSAAVASQEIIWEYRRLFVGPSRKAAPPWGSVYTDKDCVIFGESTLELRKWMREAGVETKLPEGEPEDHFGTMMLLMSWIASNRPELIEQFLSQHFLTWAGRFLEVVESESSELFFVALSQLTRRSLDAASIALDLSVPKVKFYR